MRSHHEALHAARFEGGVRCDTGAPLSVLNEQNGRNLTVGLDPKAYAATEPSNRTLSAETLNSGMVIARDQLDAEERAAEISRGDQR